MDSASYYQTVGKRIKNAMEEKHMTQTELRLSCAQRNLELSQPTLSRMLKGTDKIDAYKVAIICQVLDLNTNDVLSFGSEEKVSISGDNPNPSFITNPSDKKFKSYIETYHGYFYSTENNDTIHEGIFKFEPDSSTNKCRVSFSFETGQTDENGKKIIKEFVGTARISDTHYCICCELYSTDPDNADASYIIFKHLSISNQKCESSIGMVVTICAGTKRLPVAHKLLISRQRLSETDKPFIAGQLKLNDDVILISESDYFDFINDPLLPESFQSYVKKDTDLFLTKAARLNFYSFHEDDVLDNNILTKEEKIKVINLLRKYSNSKRCKKVGPKSEAYVFGYLMDKKKKAESHKKK